MAGSKKGEGSDNLINYSRIHNSLITSHVIPTISFDGQGTFMSKNQVPQTIRPLVEALNINTFFKQSVSHNL